VNYIAEYSLNFHAANRQRLHAEKKYLSEDGTIFWSSLNKFTKSKLVQNQNSNIPIPTFQHFKSELVQYSKIKDAT